MFVKLKVYVDVVTHKEEKEIIIVKRATCDYCNSTK